MTSFEVTDPTLRHALLNHFIERIDDKELLEALMKDGLSATLADHLVGLGRSPDVRAAVGAAGRARAVIDYSEAGMAERYTTLFDAALVRRPARLEAV